ncbi:MAG TPA: hypothetical protein VJV78_04510 [Polyangiales bacterium]|nr:hypothetical protein [Polyangiales bacterium]
MMRARSWLALLWTLASIGCSKESHVAELMSIDKLVDRDFARAVNTWSPAAVGARFEMGDGLRTGPQASAKLALRSGGRVLMKSDTVLRFLSKLGTIQPAGLFEIVSGELTVETETHDVGIGTSRGVVRVSPNSALRVRAEPSKIRFDVLVGRVEYAHEGAPQQAAAGGGFEIELLKASVEPAAVVAANPEPAPAAPDAAVVEPAAERGSAKDGPLLRDLEFRDSPPSVTFSLPAGETATIHDPAPPTDVAVVETRCPGVAVLEFDRGNGRFDAQRVRGSSQLQVRLPAGNYRYRVRCVRNGRVELASAGSGRLNVTRDAATRPLPASSARITADADGRRYTVSYQNRLPIITLRWPEAPKANEYTLKVEPERAEAFSLSSKQPSVTLPAGRLGDGVHRFEFESGRARSEQGLLSVSFDYRARTAYLTSPADNQPPQEGSTRLAGGSMVGSSVSVSGTPLKLDSQGRFSADIPAPAAGQGLAVRVQHPSAGIHYYVRHVRAP